MKDARSKLLLIVPLAVALGGVVLVVRSHSPRPTVQPDDPDETATAVPRSELPVERGVGQISLAINVPPNAELSSVSYAVLSSGHVVLARGNVAVDPHAGVVTPPAITLPAGRGDTLTVVGHAKAAAARTVYLGSRTFDVTPGGTTAVGFGAGAGVDSPAPGGVVAAAAPGGTSAATDSATACQSCELSSDQGICDSPNITATSSTNPQTGEQTGIGWGCGTLADAKARAACQALLHCLNANGCAKAGENPVTGCYCGNAAPDACIGGQGISGACIAEYQAAALASPGAPPSGTGGGQLSQFIATASSDPTTPVGLASNIEHCARETHCDACLTL